MSVVADHVLVQGSLRDAHTAAAAAVFELAAAGYLTIAPDDDRYLSVVLVRTAKPALGLQPEERVLLSALFGAGGEGALRVLGGECRVPVAQTVMGLARRRLAESGLIRTWKPRVVRRWIVAGCVALACAVALVVWVVSGHVGVFLLVLFNLSVAAGALITTVGIMVDRPRRVYRTSLGAVHARPVIAFCRRARRRDVASFMVYGLWLREKSWPESRVANPGDQPAWWRGTRWPEEAKRVHDVFDVLASALAQSVTQSGYEVQAVASGELGGSSAAPADPDHDAADRYVGDWDGGAWGGHGGGGSVDFDGFDGFDGGVDFGYEP
ncbi:hypothetical protein [Actinokineospora sp. NBRC 105648]|uniref:hypothetical protein n=1 Tax=Actinokineospora sp. NBRC 105648 TaxID=3032206 RepID=UPI0024A34D36|nr:hypothetical protein [Actinokineospora sp. NBRC 105648]GLZ40113.1 hypothetical protein Acsp05_37370 [Actinokineospora sp. NBRC 105648]